MQTIIKARTTIRSSRAIVIIVEFKDIRQANAARRRKRKVRRVIRKRNKEVMQIRTTEVLTVPRREAIQGTVTGANCKDTLRGTAQTRIPKAVMPMHSSWEWHT